MCSRTPDALISLLCDYNYAACVKILDAGRRRATAHIFCAAPRPSSRRPCGAGSATSSTGRSPAVVEIRQRQALEPARRCRWRRRRRRPIGGTPFGADELLLKPPKLWIQQGVVARDERQHVGLGGCQDHRPHRRNTTAHDAAPGAHGNAWIGAVARVTRDDANTRLTKRRRADVRGRDQRDRGPGGGDCGAGGGAARKGGGDRRGDEARQGALQPATARRGATKVTLPVSHAARDDPAAAAAQHDEVQPDAKGAPRGGGARQGAHCGRRRARGRRHGEERAHRADAAQADDEPRRQPRDAGGARRAEAAVRLARRVGRDGVRVPPLGQPAAQGLAAAARDERGRPRGVRGGALPVRGVARGLCGPHRVDDAVRVDGEPRGGLHRVELRQGEPRARAARRRRLLRRGDVRVVRRLLRAGPRAARDDEAAPRAGAAGAGAAARRRAAGGRLPAEALHAPHRPLVARANEPGWRLLLEPDETGFRGHTCTALVTADCDPAASTSRGTRRTTPTRR